MRIWSDRFKRVWFRFAWLVPALAVLTSMATAKVFLSRDDALRVAFGNDAEVERVAVFMTDAQVERARQLAGEKVEIARALITRWIGRNDGRVIGTVYLDTHRVRTLEETIMVVVNVDGTIQRIEILAFHEPEDYLPRDAWLRQFDERALNHELSTKRGIHGITGATLSAHAVTDAARRILAIHQVITEKKP